MELNILHPFTLLQIFGMLSWFICSVVIAFLFPGRLFLHKIIQKESCVVRCVLFTAFGLVLWLIQALVFGYLSVRFATYIYLGVCFVLTVKDRASVIRSVQTFISSYKIPSRLLLIIFVIGIIGQIGKLSSGGFIFSKGIPILEDDMQWHISLASELVKRVPPFEPGIVGEPIHNYYYLADLAPAEMVRVFHLPLPTTVFVFMYALQSFLFGALLFVLAVKIHLSRAGQIFLVYLGYFSSDIIYFLTFITRRVFEFTVHPLEDGTMFLENPPRAMSFILLLLGIILLHEWLEKPKKILGIFTAITLGLVIGSKAHTGIMVLIGLAGLALYFIFKRQWNRVYVPVIALATSILVYLPVNSGFGLPVFAPFEMSRMFTVQPLLKISFLELRRRVYMDHRSILRALQMDLTMLGIFMLIQFGIKNIGWFAFGIVKKYVKIPFIVFLYTSLIGTFLFGTLMIQPIEFANIFNSYLAGNLILGILAAMIADYLFKKKSTFITASLLIILVTTTLPRCVSKFVQFYDVIRQGYGKQGISRGELDTMNYIKNHTPSSDVLLVVNGSMDTVQPYVMAFTMRDPFLSGQIGLRSFKIPIAEREKLIMELLTGDSREEKIRIIQKYNLRLLYYYGDVPLPDTLSRVPFKLLFKNTVNTVYRYEGN